MSIQIAKGVHIACSIKVGVLNFQLIIGVFTPSIYSLVFS